MPNYLSKPSANGITDDNQYEEGFTAFFRKHYPSLLFYATRFLDEEQARDVVQDAFMDLWRRRHVIEKGDRLPSFMYRSVYTKALNKIKHSTIAENYGSAQREILERRLNYYSPDNNETIRRLEDNELGAQIDAQIEALPTKCREIFKLSYIHGLKNKEIAEVMGVSLKTVEAHIYKALRTLREKLEYISLTLWLVSIFWLDRII